MKKDCYKFKKELRKEQGEKKKTKEEEANTVTKDDDILFASVLSSDIENLSTWIIDSGASFHVTPHR
eukprot:c54005_g1_i1 orf=1-198(-)